MKQEQIIQIQLMEQEANQLNEQLQLIEQNVREMTELKASLDEIEGSKDKAEILANLGKKIYIPVEIKDKNLIVEVGKGNFIKKSIKDTEKVVDEQIKKLMEGRGQIMTRLEQLHDGMQKIVGEIEKEEGKKNE